MAEVLQALCVASTFILEDHMFWFLKEGWNAAGAAQSVNALYFQHEGPHCHVIAGQSSPNSIRIKEIPQNSSILELVLLVFKVLEVNVWNLTLKK